MCENDSTYRGTAERQDFYFKSPLAKLEENEDEYSRCWVYMSDNFKNKLKSFLEHLNDEQGFKLPHEDELTSYEVHIGVRPQCGQPSVNLGAY